MREWMKKLQIKGFVVGALVAVIVSGTLAVSANAGGVMREVFYGVSVIVNGTPQNFATEDRPFIMDGRTFLPVRAISEALGQSVEWDEETSTVRISSETEAFTITLHCPEQDVILVGGFHHVSGQPIRVFVPRPTREGYVFDGFIDHLDQKIFLSDGRPAFIGPWTMISDHTLRAIWSEASSRPFVITLHCSDQDTVFDGGFSHVDGQPIRVTIPVPTREGYIFDGFIDHLDQRIFLSDGRPAFTGPWTMTSDHTLRAIWRDVE